MGDMKQSRVEGTRVVRRPGLSAWFGDGENGSRPGGRGTTHSTGRFRLLCLDYKGMAEWRDCGAACNLRPCQITERRQAA